MRHLATALIAACALGTGASAAPPFKHIVIVIQENRTPDNLFGSNPTFEPGVDLATSGVTSQGQIVPLTPVTLKNCYDIQHTHISFENALTQGFDTEPKSDNTCPGKSLPPNPHYKYVDNTTGTVQPYFDIATANGFANRMFQTNQGPSFPAHQFLFGGTSAPTASSSLFVSGNMKKHPNLVTGAGCTAPPHQTTPLIDSHGSELSHAPIFPCLDHQTLGDLLSAANPTINWRYYAPTPGSIWTAPDAINHICQPAIVNGKRECTGPIWASNVIPNNSAQVLTDIQNCGLPGVSWVIPAADESDHANGNKGLGPQWVASIVNAIGKQSCPGGESYWSDTAIFITWDDWGGWFDHVKPFAVNLNTHQWGSGYTYGFRVPLLVVSAYTPANFVSNDVFDFGSILAFTERNFGLGFIGPGNAPYGQYADYHSTLAPFGDLASFFTLPSAKPFVPIAVTMRPQDFINAPKSQLPPDND